MKRDIAEYLRRNSKIEQARENAFLSRAYRELAKEQYETCPICHKIVDDVKRHVELTHGGKQKTLFEMYAEPKMFGVEDAGVKLNQSGGWDELEPRRYPHASAPKGYTNDERNVTQDISEEDLLTSDLTDEYTSIVPTDNMKHQTQNLQNSKENDDEGVFYTHDGKAEDWDIPFYKTPDNYYRDKGDEGDWDDIEPDEDLVPLDQFDSEEDELDDIQKEEIDTLRQHGISDKTLHLDMGYNKKDLGEGAYGSGRRGHQKWMKDAEIIETVEEENMNRNHFIKRAEEILAEFNPVFTSEQVIKNDCSSCSESAYEKWIKSLEGTGTSVYPNFEEIEEEEDEKEF